MGYIGFLGITLLTICYGQNFQGQLSCPHCGINKMDKEFLDELKLLENEINYDLYIQGVEDITFQYNVPGSGDARLLSDELPIVPEEYQYTQSTLQGFYFVDAIEVDGEDISDNSWILAYNDGIIVGARMWNGSYTDIPAMGNDGSYATTGYMEDGNVPTFKLVDLDGSMRDLYVSGSIDTWTNNGVEVITLSTTPVIPEEVSLSDSYPNPFNPSTMISFSIPTEMNVDLKIYDIQGRIVGELMSGIQSQGLYEIAWNASRNASGIYFVRLVAGAEIHTQKITLVK